MYSYMCVCAFKYMSMSVCADVFMTEISIWVLVCELGVFRF